MLPSCDAGVVGNLCGGTSVLKRRKVDSPKAIANIAGLRKLDSVRGNSLRNRQKGAEANLAFDLPKYTTSATHGALG